MAVSLTDILLIEKSKPNNISIGFQRWLCFNREQGLRTNYALPKPSFYPNIYIFSLYSVATQLYLLIIRSKHISSTNTFHYENMPIQIN